MAYQPTKEIAYTDNFEKKNLAFSKKAPVSSARRAAQYMPTMRS